MFFKLLIYQTKNDDEIRSYKIKTKFVSTNRFFSNKNIEIQVFVDHIRKFKLTIIYVVSLFLHYDFSSNNMQYENIELLNDYN